MDVNQYNRLTISQIPSDFSIQRKILVEEIFEDLQSKTTFIRKINCQQIYDYQKDKVSISFVENASKVDNGGESKSNADCAIRRTTFQGFLLNHDVPTHSENYKSDNYVSCITKDIGEETPMEIDTSSDQLMIHANDLRKMNQDELISNRSKFRKRKSKNSISNEITCLEDTDTYSKLIPIDQPLISRFSTILLIIGVLLMLLVVYIVITRDHIYINKNIQLENLKKDLHEYVMHQEEAIKLVIQNFERMDTWEGVKILPFIGSTGVGKTFTVNIIKKNIHPQLIHEMDTNQLRKQNKILANLNDCCCNIIIIDNLRASNFDDFMDFVKALPKSLNLLIIPIFNIQDTVDGLTYVVREDDFKLIRDKLQNSKLYYELVLFDVLKSQMIEKWLRRELHKRQINENRHDSLVKFLLDNNQVKYKGFKGLNSQLLLALDNK